MYINPVCKECISMPITISISLNLPMCTLHIYWTNRANPLLIEMGLQEYYLWWHVLTLQWGVLYECYWWWLIRTLQSMWGVYMSITYVPIARFQFTTSRNMSDPSVVSFHISNWVGAPLHGGHGLTYPSVPHRWSTALRPLCHLLDKEAMETQAACLSLPTPGQRRMLSDNRDDQTTDNWYFCADILCYGIDY